MWLYSFYIFLIKIDRCLELFEKIDIFGSYKHGVFGLCFDATGMEIGECILIFVALIAVTF